MDYVVGECVSNIIVSNIYKQSLMTGCSIHHLDVSWTTFFLRRIVCYGFQSNPQIISKDEKPRLLIGSPPLEFASRTLERVTKSRQ